MDVSIINMHEPKQTNGTQPASAASPHLTSTRSRATVMAIRFFLIIGAVATAGACILAPFVVGTALQSFPENESFRWPFTIGAAIFGASTLVLLLAIWKLLGVTRSFLAVRVRWVDVAIGAITTALLAVAFVLTWTFFLPAQHIGVTLAGLGVIAALALVDLLVAVLRRLLLTAISMEEDLETVI